MQESKVSPIIGITTYGANADDRYDLPVDYVEAVRKAGGVPLLLPPGESNIEEILNILHGLIFSGGGDIEPTLYNGSQHPEIDRVDVERDRFKIALARAAFETDIAVMGICRGSQLLAVASGGGLVEHLPDQYGDGIAHRRNGGDSAQHPVKIEKGCRLEGIFEANEVNVISDHHQCYRTIPDIWNVVGYAPDGVAKALEHKAHRWALALLWHPERSTHDRAQMKLFESLVDAAREQI